MVHLSICCLYLTLCTCYWSAVASFQANRHPTRYPTASVFPSWRFHQPKINPAVTASTVAIRSRLVLLDATTVALSSLDALFRSAPYAIAAVTCGIKASSADWVAQVHQQQQQQQEQLQQRPTKLSDAPSQTTRKTTRCRIDMKRNISFLMYGAIYQGMAQEFIYNRLYPTLFGAGTSVGVVLTKVAFDLLIQTTLATLPIAYLTKAVIYRYTWRESLRRYRDDILNHGLLTKYYMIWGPVQCMTFSIIPAHFRVSFIACVSFFWLIILSTISSTRAESDTTERPKCEFVDGMTCNIEG